MRYKTVIQWFETISLEHADRVAIKQGDHTFSYGTLATQAKRVAHALVNLDTQKGDCVGVLLPSGVHLVASLLACFKSGRVYLPLDKKFPDKRLHYILNQCQPSVLVISSDMQALVTKRLQGFAHTVKNLLVINEWDHSFKIVKLIDAGAEEQVWDFLGREDTSLFEEIDEQDSSYVFYTSGSTGNPKAILGAHHGLVHFIDWEIEEFELNHTCRVSQLTHSTFDASLRDIFIPLCTGGTLCIPPEDVRENPATLVQWIQENQITLMHCVPSMFRIILKGIEITPTFNQLKHVMISGEALYSSDILQWRERVGQHVQLVNFYGATETTMIKLFYPIQEVDLEGSAPVPVGKPIKNTVAAIINEGHICLPGEIGEIYIKTAFWTKGYGFEKELNKHVFIQNPLVLDREDIVYKTGDLGRYVHDGNIELVGRIDSQVKVNGIRIELEEIEHAIRKIKGVDQALVTSYINHEGDTELIGYYTGKAIEAAELRIALQNELTESSIPSYFQHLLEFPLTINGKIDKKALNTPEELLLKQQTFEPVQPDLEEKLEGLWKEILDVSKVGRKASFFNLGGTSLKAIRLIARIYKEFGLVVKVADIFTNATIEKMAKFISHSTSQTVADIVPVAKSDFYPVTFQQKRLWIISKANEASTAYNMPAAFSIKGQLQMDALNEALTLLLERHESLRTTFAMENGEVVQKIGKAEPTVIPFYDLSSDKNPEHEAMVALFEEAQQPLHTEDGPLFSVVVFRLARHWHYLFITTHHIISDAWSMQIIARDLISFYQTCSKRVPPQLPTLSVQYKDYGIWLRHQLAERHAEHERYWLQQFQGELPVLHLPTDFERSKEQRFDGAKILFDGDKILSNKILHYCKQENITLFTFLIGGVKALLYCLSGQKDIIVGVPFAGRNHKSLEDQVGFFVNTIALRSRFEAEINVSDFLQNLKAVLLATHEHSIYPFEQLVELLHANKDRSRTALIDVMVQMQEMNTKNLLQLPDGMEMQQINLNFGGSKFDLTFNFELVQESHLVAGWIEYNNSLYLESTVQNMLTMLFAVFDEIASKKVSMAALKQSLTVQFRSEVKSSTEAFGAHVTDEF
jgi:amino acid adenylation domain-containing protein